MNFNNVIDIRQSYILNIKQTDMRKEKLALEMIKSDNYKLDTHIKQLKQQSKAKEAELTAAVEEQSELKESNVLLKRGNINRSFKINEFFIVQQFNSLSDFFDKSTKLKQQFNSLERIVAT